MTRSSRRDSDVGLKKADSDVEKMYVGFRNFWKTTRHST